MKFPVTKNPNPGTMPPADKLGFGSVFSDHMFIMDYSGKEGWHDPRIVPFGPLSLSPAASVFHYAGEVFEGLKAYRRKDGKVQLFRHDANVERLNNSAERIGLPLVPADIAMAAIEQLVEVDQAWVPSAPGTSLYIRPFLFSTDPELSLHGVHQAMFVIILSPSGSYYAEGLNPGKIMMETEDVRAVRGGTGYTKCGGNYAASNRAGDRAMEKGYSQVLWLDGVERKYVEEVGAMNVFFVFEDPFSVGDMIDAGGITGTVESIGLRTTTVRAFTGEVSVIPNGSIRTLTNYSRTNSLAIVDIPVALSADADAAMALMRQEAERYCAEIADKVCQSPEIYGVNDVSPFAKTLRLVVSVKPLEHWAVQRELRKRILERFVREGIKLPAAERSGNDRRL